MAETMENATSSEVDRLRDFARRFHRTCVKAIIGHQRPMLNRRGSFEELRVATCDADELLFLRELRQDLIEAEKALWPTTETKE